MATKKTFLLIVSTAIMGAVYANPAETGKTIFTTRCAACHNVNKVIIGPALSGVDKRHSTDWIIQFVHSSQTMVKAGDKDAVALFQKFNRVAMPVHTDLKEEDIKGVIAYIKAEGMAVSATSAPFAKPGKRRPGHTPPGSGDYLFFCLYFFALAALVRALIYAVQLRSYIRKGVVATTV